MDPKPCSACKRVDGFCCADARDIYKRLEAYFFLGIATGDWYKFDLTRALLEKHYREHLPKESKTKG